MSRIKNTDNDETSTEEVKKGEIYMYGFESIHN